VASRSLGDRFFLSLPYSRSGFRGPSGGWRESVWDRIVWFHGSPSRFPRRVQFSVPGKAAEGCPVPPTGFRLSELLGREKEEKSRVAPEKGTVMGPGLPGKFPAACRSPAVLSNRCRGLSPYPAEHVVRSIGKRTPTHSPPLNAAMSVPGRRRLRLFGGPRVDPPASVGERRRRGIRGGGRPGRSRREWRGVRGEGRRGGRRQWGHRACEGFPWPPGGSRAGESGHPGGAR